MPFKSQAQRRKFAELLVNGEISPDTFEEWNRETGGKHLPERVVRKTRKAKKKKKKNAKGTRRAKARPRPKAARAGKRTTLARARRHSR